MRIDVLWEDEDLLVVNKPSGIPCHATLDPKRPHLFGLLSRQLSLSGPEIELILVHRLDVGTSGVVLFARTRAFAEGLARQFREREVKKIYRAVVVCGEKSPNKGWRVDNFLAESKKSRGKMHAVRAGGARALTEFQLLGRKGERALIEARPLTGRKHQIRVHLAESGFPIVGDELYGSVEWKARATRLLLHAWKLEIRHPRSGLIVRVEAPLPAEFVI